MTKIRLAILATLAVVFTAFLTVPSADASPSAYTRVYRSSRGYVPGMTVICHYLQQPKTLQWGDDSFTKCPATGGQTSGWIDKVIVPSLPGETLRVHVRNVNNNVQTDYPCGENAIVGGGYYEVWANAVGC